MSQKRILILCTGNSARSQVAKGLRHMAGRLRDVQRHEHPLDSNTLGV